MNSARTGCSALLRELKEGSEIDEAVRTAYGIGLDELDERWRNWLIGGRGEAGTLDSTNRTNDGLDSVRDSQAGGLEAYGASDVLALASNSAKEAAEEQVRPEPGAALDTATVAEDASRAGSGAAARTTDVAGGIPWLPIGAGAAALLFGAVVAAAAWRLRRD